MSEVNGVDYEAEASQMGWVSEEKFKGDKARWIPAQEFVERGQTVLPILKKNNQELLGKLTSSQAEVAALKTSLQSVSNSVEDLRKFHVAETKRQVEAQVTSLKASLKAARTEGDNEAAAEIAEVLDETKDKLKTLSTAPPPPPPPAPPPPKGAEPWAVAWNEENKDWFNVDKKRTALFLAAGEEQFSKGLRERALLDAAKEDMEAVFAPAPSSKAEEGKGGGGGSGGGPRTPSFANLPADAKAVCLDQIPKFVGKGKAFKDEAAWKAHYVKTFFES